jgi:hypothetical protein
VPLLLETITPHAADGGRAVLAAWDFLRRIERLAAPPMHEAPLRIVMPAWRRLVVRADKSIDRRAYTFCVLPAVLAAFKRRDLYVMPSQRWGDPRAQLLTGDAWQAQRTSVCRVLGGDEQPEPELAYVHASWTRPIGALPTTCPPTRPCALSELVGAGNWCCLAWTSWTSHLRSSPSRPL